MEFGNTSKIRWYSVEIVASSKKTEGGKTPHIYVPEKEKQTASELQVPQNQPKKQKENTKQNTTGKYF